MGFHQVTEGVPSKEIVRPRPLSPLLSGCEVGSSTLLHAATMNWHRSKSNRAIGSWNQTVTQNKPCLVIRHCGCLLQLAE